ncbi:DNA-binding domain-containing protein [Massilia sp. CF038]|uniref:HvfC/BufC N-terminal domain-containing protein n=1 Tax=Massilia sp. CF038 TaxID=1881045 RepID=UPI00091DAEE4|nr:DNA-binding domain-containing protein [Massilia sp. CF038]SHH43842.1 Putative DNA-binding domain-containing protein [Massilia sp. CF038]
MNALPQLQAAFQDYVLGEGDATPMLPAVRQQGALSPAARLAIYHNAYRARMREALGEAFERTWTYIGDDLFNQMAGAYLLAHPSSFHNLRWYGDAFPAFLREQLAEHPFVAELAQFEWTLGLAFDAPDAAPASMDALRLLAPQDWAAQTFVLHPAVQLLTMQHNSVALWQGLGDACGPPEPAALASPQTWLVWRHNLQPHFRSLAVDEAAALMALRAGASFGAICADAQSDDAATLVATWLRDWLGTGMLRATVVANPATLVDNPSTTRHQHENHCANPPGQQDHRRGRPVEQT